MVLLLNKMFGKTGEEGDTGPTFDGDPTRMQLIVRGTAGEIEQVRDIVNRMDPVLGSESEVRTTTRLIPLTGRQLEEILLCG